MDVFEMPGFGPKVRGRDYRDPSPVQIRARAAAIRREWNDATRKARVVKKPIAKFLEVPFTNLSHMSQTIAEYREECGEN